MRAPIYDLHSFCFWVTFNTHPENRAIQVVADADRIFASMIQNGASRIYGLKNVSICQLLTTQV